jgi:acyl-CoA thioester hydrolase
VAGVNPGGRRCGHPLYSPAMTRHPPQRHEPQTRADFRRFHRITTRWKDNDVFGHVNNVVYYSFFDTAVTSFLLEHGILDIATSELITVVAETNCRYRRELAFPDLVTVGFRIGHLGRTSVRYELAIFRNEEDEAAAEGHFVHVFVGRATMRPEPIPQRARDALATLVHA